MHKNTDLSGDFLFFFLLSPFQKGAQTQHKRKSRDPKKMIMLSPIVVIYLIMILLQNILRNKINQFSAEGRFSGYHHLQANTGIPMLHGPEFQSQSYHTKNVWTLFSERRC